MFVSNPKPFAPPIPESFFDFDKYKDQLSKEELKSRHLIKHH